MVTMASPATGWHMLALITGLLRQKVVPEQHSKHPQPVMQSPLSSSAPQTQTSLPLRMQVEHVVLLQDIQLQAENWYRTAGSRSNLTNRNITISSEPPHRTLDFAFLASNWFRLGAGKSLNISQTILKQGR
jgi:hypothetical protein